MPNLNTVIETSELRETEVVIPLPPLSLDDKIDDNSLAKLINDRLTEDEKYYKLIKLDSRRKELEEFYIGNQVDSNRLDSSWQMEYVDNIMYRNLRQALRMTTDKLPDISGIPPKGDPLTRERARKIQQVLEIRILNENIKRMIRDGVRDDQMKFIGVIKVIWDANSGENGDYHFRLLDPRQVSFDHTGRISYDGYSCDEIDTIYEWVEDPVSVVVAKFPDKKEELFQKLKIVRGTTGQMAAKIRYQEVHFTWYDNGGKRFEGVAWKYGNLILGKTKDPYYDWEGIQQKTNELNQDGKPKVKTVFQNYFERPRKPYILFNYDNLGNSPIDDTSAFEQSMSLQKNINKRGRQINEIADNAVPKKVFSGSAITKEEARRVSNDPSEHIWMDIDQGTRVSDVFATIPAVPPSPVLFSDLVSNRQEIDSMFATHGGTRGEQSGSNQSGLSKQITREGDVAISDDVVETTVVRVVTEMCGWALQMMKSQYNKEHDLHSIGKDGVVTSVSIDQTMIDDGIGIQVRASTTDKIRRRSEALDMANSGNTDPLSMFEDLDVPNPRERAERMIAWASAKQTGDYSEYERITGLDKEKQNMGISNLDREQALEDLQNIKEGKPVTTEGIPTREYVQTLIEFVNSSDIKELQPASQQKLAELVKRMQAKAQEILDNGGSLASTPPVDNQMPPIANGNPIDQNQNMLQ